MGIWLRDGGMGLWVFGLVERTPSQKEQGLSCANLHCRKWCCTIHEILPRRHEKGYSRRAMAVLGVRWRATLQTSALDPNLPFVVCVYTRTSRTLPSVRRFATYLPSQNSPIFKETARLVSPRYMSLISFSTLEERTDPSQPTIISFQCLRF
jgi:hypothetical protein